MDYRQMLSPTMEADFQCQFSTGFAANKCPGTSTWRPTRPIFTRLMAWLSVGWEFVVVDFVGSPAAER